MAVNVTYQIPAALYAERRNREKRAYRQQMRLQQEKERARAQQQAFQLSMADADFQRRQALQEQAYNANLAYQKQAQEAKRLDAQEQRDFQRSMSDAEFQRKQALQEQAYREREQIQNEQFLDARFANAMKAKQALESGMNYTQGELQELTRMNGALADLDKKYYSGELTRPEYMQAREIMRGNILSVRPSVPKTEEEKLSPQQKFRSDLIEWDAPGGEKMYFIPDGKGGYKDIRQGQEIQKRQAEYAKIAMNAAMKDGVYDSETFNRAYNDLMEHDPDYIRKKQIEAEEERARRAKQLEANKLRMAEYAREAIKKEKPKEFLIGGKKANVDNIF